ncbi:molybdenum ABC transporter ATP-binding protein [Zavarzinia compransoris]|uniref:Molybdenum ABC transporter ATP-binding protein n=1 Tax=Zavarzinia compransoris TaxID=1264899 RepID=A0A317DWX9_9PROT|nr:molybdenum ABC transporter ATP-binding protein [Zavarzinia compransoris]PWR19031.1 molybdenum ABC transporter ATP-binding protein [Zavarzinia compransoris]TDP49038.1 molybdate transport system ATP-binding protein [Zavarzinia compransoris]
MSLDLDLLHRAGDFTLEVAFRAEGRVTSLFGPSGAGKSTVVNAIAGLLRPARGRIAVDGTVLLDTERRIDVRPHRRRIGYVFQEGRLFPHMTVRQNLLYGRFFAPRGAPALALDTVVGLLGIAPLLQRRPRLLSGGEKQRVAIGRALLSAPRLLLMDEPLSALDDGRRHEVLPFLHRLAEEALVPIVHVSHRLDEVVELASHLVVLDGGQVRAAGAVEDLMGRVDVPVLAARQDAGAVMGFTVLGHDDDDGTSLLEGPIGHLTVPRLDAAVGSRRRLWLHARDVLIATEVPKGLSARNILPARVAALAEGPGGIDVQLACGRGQLIARLTRGAVADLGLYPGLAVQAIVKSRAFG